MTPHPLATFLSYSHANQKHRKKLRQHFVQLEREGLIRLWDDRELRVGEEFDASIGTQLEQTEVFILLVSQDFIASQYCSGIEMKRALERHEQGQALVLPIIASPCDWKHSPLAKLVVAPTDGKPISSWSPRDAGWADATVLARQAIATFRQRRFGPPEPQPVPAPAPAATPAPLPPLLPPPLAPAKTDLVEMYITLPGFELPKTPPIEDLETTTRVPVETLAPPPAPAPAEKTELLQDLPPPPPSSVPAPEPPTMPSAAQSVVPPPEPREPPPPQALAPAPEKAAGRSWKAVGLAVVSALLLIVVAMALVCGGPR